jgi:hypothetical protein
MPWRQVNAMNERFQVIRDARQRLVTFTELCALYGISRTVGYKWLHRAEQSGLDYLQELSRRPHSSPHATPPELTARLLEARRHHPSWGPRGFFPPAQVVQVQRVGAARNGVGNRRLSPARFGSGLLCSRTTGTQGRHESRQKRQRGNRP